MAKFSELNGKQKAIYVIVVIAVFMIVFLIVSAVFNGLDGGNSQIEIISEPQMTIASGAFGYYPVVKVTIRNKTDQTITVQMECTIYDKNGNLTETLTSRSIIFNPGETGTITTVRGKWYAITNYAEQCASFGNVEYKVM